MVANEVVNRGGVSFVFRAMEEAGASEDDVVRAFLVAREVFGLPDFVAQVESLDNVAGADVQADLYLSFRRLLDQAVRRLAARRDQSVADQVKRYQRIHEHWGSIGQVLRGSEEVEYDARVASLRDAGVTADLAVRTAELPAAFALLDVVDLAAGHEVSDDEVLRTWFALVDTLRIGDLLTSIRKL